MVHPIPVRYSEYSDDRWEINNLAHSNQCTIRWLVWTYRSFPERISLMCSIKLNLCPYALDNPIKKKKTNYSDIWFSPKNHIAKLRITLDWDLSNETWWVRSTSQYSQLSYLRSTLILKEVSCSWHVRNFFNNFHSGTDLSYQVVNLGRAHQAATLKLKLKLL